MVPYEVLVLAIILLTCCTYIVWRGREDADRITSQARKDIDTLFQSNFSRFEQLYDALYTPILAPMPTGGRFANGLWVEQTQAAALKVRNIGTGVALNVRAVVCNPAETADQYMTPAPDIFGAGEKSDILLERGHFLNLGEGNILTDAIVATPITGKLRLVIFYNTVLGEHLASVWDLTNRGTWQFIQMQNEVIFKCSDTQPLDGGLVEEALSA